MKPLEGNAGKTLEDTNLSREILKRPQGALEITAETKDSGRVMPTTYWVKEPAVWEETFADCKSDPDKFLESTYFKRKAKNNYIPQHNKRIGRTVLKRSTNEPIKT